MTRKALIFIIFTVFWTASDGAFAAAMDGKQNYAYAMKAVETGDLKLALVYFHRAERAGMHTSALIYNLGVIYYKLGYYPSAYAAFYELFRHNELSDLAQYNLALVSSKIGRSDVAKQWLHSGIRIAKGNVKNLYENMLLKLEPKPVAKKVSALAPTPKASHNLLLVNFDSSFGYDSNVSLRSDADLALQRNLETAATGKDKYSQYATTGTYMYRSPRNDLMISATSYKRRYQQETTYDFLSYGSNLRITHRFPGISVGVAGDFHRHRLGEVDFEDVITYEANLYHQTSHSYIGAAYIQANLKSLSEPYNYLSGARSDIRSLLDFHHGRHHYGLIFQYEVNDREDYRAGDVFHSYSPQTNHASVYYTYRYHKLSYNLSFSGNESTFRGIDTNGVPEQDQHRHDTQSVASNKITIQFNKSLQMYLQLSITENESNLKPNSFSKQDMSAGLSWKLQ